MRTFKKFNNREEYKNWVIDLLEKLERWEKSIWEPEDNAILLPFWRWDNRRGRDESVPDDIKHLITFYIEKSKEYADERKSLVSSFAKLNDIHRFLTFFMFEYDEDEDDESEFYRLSDFKLDEMVPDEPFICYIWVDSGFDRLGNMDIQVIDFVTEKELKSS